MEKLAFLFALCSILISPIVMAITILNEGVRLFVSVMFLFSRYNLVTGMDNTFLVPKLSSNMVVTALYSRDTIIVSEDVGSFRRALSKREADGRFTYEKMRRIFCIKFGYHCVKTRNETEFRIENHVKIPDFVKVEEEIAERDFTANILPTLLQSMDESKPQWEWLIFPKIRRISGELNSVRVFRWNHAYMDGVSAGIFMVENIFDKTGSHEFIIDPKLAIVTSWFKLLGKCWAGINLPLILCLAVLKSLTKLRFASTTTRSKDPYFVEEYKSPHTLGGPTTIDLKLVKDAARKNTRNIVAHLISCCGSSLTHCLPKDEKTEGDSGIKIGLLLADPPYHGNKLRNSFSAVCVSPEELRGLRRDWNFYVFPVLVSWVGRLPVCLMSIFAPVGDFPTVHLNNVPFLKERGRIGGCLVEEIASWTMLCAPVGVNLVAISYGDRLTLSGHSVEDCLMAEQIQEILHDFGNRLVVNASPGDS